ncbi:MAG: hypothetical protein ACPG6V_00985 [Flavobacteriales bacterium]
MNIKKKLMYYGFGVLLGILAVNVFWDSKDIRMTYFPSSRIQNDLSKKNIEYSKQALEQMNGLSISKGVVAEKLNKQEFSASLLDREAKPCKTYSLTSEFNEKEIGFTFQNCDSIATIINVELK